MKKFLKIFVIVIVVLLIAAVSLPFIFKDKIIQMAKDEANKNLNAKVDWGSFDLTILSSFPDFTFVLNDLKVVGVKEFEKDTLLALKEMKLQLNLMSVIKGEQIKIHKVILDHPRINAIVLKDGKANWDITKPSADTAKAAPAEPTKFKVALKEFKIIDGNIVYDDMQGNMKAILTNMNHTLKGDFTQDIFDIESNTEIAELTYIMDGVKYFSKVKTGVDFNSTMDMPNFKFTFKENEFRLNELAFGLDGFWAMPKDDMDMDLKFKAKKADFKEFLSLVPGVYTKDFASVKTSGKLAFDGYAKGVYNDKRMPAFGIKLLVENAYFQYPSLPKAVKNINIDLKVDNATGVPDNTIINLNKCHIEMAENPVDAKLHVTTPVSDANIDGWVKGKIVLASVKEFIPMEPGEAMNGTINMDVTMKGKMSYIDKEQYEQFDMKGMLEIMGMDYKSKDVPYGVTIQKASLNFTPKQVDLTAFDSKIGKTDFHMQGAIENFIAYALRDEMLKGHFNAQSAYMDINEFMTPSEPAPTPAAGTTPPPADANATPAEVPGNLDFVLKSDFKKVLYDKIEISNLSGDIIIKDKQVTMKDVKMNMLDGSLTMNGYYNTQNIKVPKVDFDMDIAHFDLPKTFNAFNTVQKLAPAAKYATGKVSTTVKFTSDLDNTMSPVMNTLNGSGRLKTEGVVIKGTPSLVKLGEALKQKSFEQLEVNNTDIYFEFKDGKVTVKPFDVKYKSSAVNIGGDMTFDQKLNYKMAFDIPTSELGSAANNVMQGLLSQANSKGANMKMGERIKFDALIGGTFTNPTVKTGLKDMVKSQVEAVKEQVKEKVEEKIQEVKEDVKAKARAEADKILADAEKEAQRIRDEGAKLADAAKAEGYKAADELEKKAKNPLEKVAAKKAAEKVRKESDEKAGRIKSESDKKATDILNEARKKADEKLK